MTRGIRLTGFSAVALLAALVLFLSSVDSTRATPPPFDPGGIVCFENLESGAECDGDTSAGAVTDLRSRFCIGWSADCSQRNPAIFEKGANNQSNFGGVVGFTPKDWNLPKGDTIPIGAIAGRLESEATLGLLNNPCSNRINVAFTMMNASININDTISPRPEGSTDVMQPLAMDKDPANGIPDGADKYPKFLAEFFKIDGQTIQPRARLFGISHIQGSWVALNFVFFEPGQTVEVAQTRITFDPALGYPSITILQDPTSQAAPSAITDFCGPLLSANITLGKTINNPCTPTPVAGANCPVTSDTAPETKERGYPAFPCDIHNKHDEDGDGKINDGCPQYASTAETGAECDNDKSDDAEDAAVNDGCPKSGDLSEGERIPGACSGGDEGGCNHRTNPGSGGTYTFTTMALSQRDADGDGFENGLDTCFKDPNPEWNPRAADPVNDADGDGIPKPCDNDDTKADSKGVPGSPTGCKSGYTGADEDDDCFANRADNCPLDKQLKDNNQPPDNYPDTPQDNPPLTTDTDRDGIGDACDPDPNAPNGDYIGYCLQFGLNVGGAAGPVTPQRAGKTAPECAAQGPIVTPPPGTSIQGGTSGGGTTGGTTGGGAAGGGGVGGGPVTGVGSLSPTATGFPVWAAVLAGLGAIGIVSGLALYTRLAPRRNK